LEPTVPDPTTRAIGRKYTVRNTYGIEQWMDQAIITAAHKTGQTQADVVRACLEHGLNELYGQRKPSLGED
jgi:predicted DNA-binding protein